MVETPHAVSSRKENAEQVDDDRAAPRAHYDLVWVLVESLTETNPDHPTHSGEESQTDQVVRETTPDDTNCVI